MESSFREILYMSHMHISFPVMISHSLRHLVGAGHGDETFATFLIGPSCCDRQRPLPSVHLHPEATVVLPAAVWPMKKRGIVIIMRWAYTPSNLHFSPGGKQPSVWGTKEVKQPFWSQNRKWHCSLWIPVHHMEELNKRVKLPMEKKESDRKPKLPTHSYLE